MPAEIRSLAEFLDIPINEDQWDDILLHCSFDYMKANATKSVPLGGAFWDGGAETFIHKGVNGRWLDVLSEQEALRYEQRATEELGDECAHWLQTGEYKT
jgi:aryl sulfotransferase